MNKDFNLSYIGTEQEMIILAWKTIDDYLSAESKLALNRWRDDDGMTWRGTFASGAMSLVVNEPALKQVMENLGITGHYQYLAMREYCASRLEFITIK